MVCDTCTKKIKKYGREECAVLADGSRRDRRGLMLWGPNCSAYSDDPEWEIKVLKQVAEYAANKGLIHQKAIIQRKIKNLKKGDIDGQKREASKTIQGKAGYRK